MREALLRDITEFCRHARMAESTFGRLAVNDGKLVNRLRLGGRVTTETAERVRAFIAGQTQGQIGPEVNGSESTAVAPLIPPGVGEGRQFSFLAKRQKSQM